MDEEVTSLTTQNAKGVSVTIPVPKGTDVTIDTVALHYNPRYWKNPHQFNPSRFWTTIDRAMHSYRSAAAPVRASAETILMPPEFHRFFETEGIAILTLLARNVKITVKDEPRFANETFDQRKAHVLDAKAGLTLTPKRVPLTFPRQKWR